MLELRKTIQLYSDEKQNETAIRNSIRNFYEQTKNIRSGNQICSLTTSYKKDIKLPIKPKLTLSHNNLMHKLNYKNQ